STLRSVTRPLMAGDRLAWRAEVTDPVSSTCWRMAVSCVVATRTGTASFGWDNAGASAPNSKESAAALRISGGMRGISFAGECGRVTTIGSDCYRDEEWTARLQPYG